MPVEHGLVVCAPSGHFVRCGLAQRVTNPLGAQAEKPAFRQHAAKIVVSWLWHRKIFSKSVTSWRFNGTMAANRISTLNASVARVRAQLAAANRTYSEMFRDRRSDIPMPAFSSTVSSSWAVTHCNRAGTMATTLGFTASNICGGCLQTRRRNEDCPLKNHQPNRGIWICA